MNNTVSISTGEKSIAVGGDVINSVIWIGDNLLSGIKNLPTDYGARLSNFLTEYLGTNSKPVPFGGRDGDLDQLSNWLNDRKTSPYLLLAAPAGRGKSALLTRWVKSLEVKDDFEVLFWPISIRFRTNLGSVTFPSLAARLAHLHGEKTSLDMQTSIEAWRGIVSDYLQKPLPNGKKLLIVIDGLDEAADWEPGIDLFPLEPNPELRIVVSARFMAGDVDSSNWLERLGWNRAGLALAPSLTPIDHAGVRDILVTMGCPLDVLGKRADIISEIYRLSEGDPLLIRLYVDDLWIRGSEVNRLEPRDLSKNAPGLNGYFKRWWDDQRKLWGEKAPLQGKSVQTVLNLLATAIGPLSKEDLITLSDLSLEINTFTIDGVLSPLARFITGDGDKQGYVFSHPRLAQYFYEQLIPREKEIWEKRFLSWGKENIMALNAHTLDPRLIPLYIVQYYGAHLERSNASIDDFMELVSHHWSMAWFSKEGSYASFLKDVDRAWQACNRNNSQSPSKNAPLLIENEIRCALVASSLYNITNNIPISLPCSLVRANVWSPIQAVLNVRQLADKREAFLAFENLAPYIPEDKIEDVLTLIAGINDEYHLSSLIVQISERIPKKLIPTAISIVKQIKTHHLQTIALASLARISPELVPVILENLRKIQNIATRASAFRTLAGKFPEYTAETLDLIDQVTDEFVRADIISFLSENLLDIHLPRLIKTLRKINDPYYRASISIKLIDQHPEAETITFEAFSQLANKRQVAELLISAKTLSPRLLEELKRLSSNAKNKGYQARLLAALSWHINVENKVLLESINNLDTLEQRAEVLVYLAVRDSKYLTKALKSIKKINSLDKQVDLLITLSVYHDKVLAFIQSELEGSPDLYFGLSYQYPEFAKQVLETSQRIDDLEKRAETLCILSLITVDLLPQTLLTIQEIRPTHQQALYFCFLARQYPYLLPHAIELTRQMPDAGSKTDLMIKLYEKFPEIASDLLTSLEQVKGTARRRDLINAIMDIDNPISDDFLARIKELKNVNVKSEILIGISKKIPESVSEIDLQQAEFTVQNSSMQNARLNDEIQPILFEWGSEMWGGKVGVNKKFPLFELENLITKQKKKRAKQDKTPYQALHKSLKTFANQYRSNSLDAIINLVSLIESLGGKKAVVESGNIIIDVAKWWS